MVCFSPFGTPHAHIYDNNLFFPCSQLPCWWVRGKGTSQEAGGGGANWSDVVYCYCCQLIHPQMFGHPRQTFKSSYDGALRCRLHLQCQEALTVFCYISLKSMILQKIKVTYDLNNMKLYGSYDERRGQVSIVVCFIFTIPASIGGFKLLSLTARFEANFSVLPNCLTCTRLTFSAPQSVICLTGS